MNEIKDKYFDIIITNDNFRITESYSKPLKETALSVLIKIETVLKRKMRYVGNNKDQYSHLTEECLAEILKRKAIEIRDGYLLKNSRKIFSQVDQVNAAARRINFLVSPAKTLLLPNELILEIISYLSISDLAKFSLLNREGRALGYQSMSKRAFKYGHEKGIHGNGMHYLQELFRQTKMFCWRYPIVKKYCSYHKKTKINFEESLLNFKSMSIEDLIDIFSDENFYFNSFNILKIFLINFNKFTIIYNKNYYKNRCKAIINAAKYNEKDILEFLLHNGINPNICEEEGGAPLHFATLEGHLEIIETLLNNGADINLQANGSYATPLHYACKHTNSHVTVVERLLSLGADPKITDINWHTPLQLAVKVGRQDIVELFLKKA